MSTLALQPAGCDQLRLLSVDKLDSVLSSGSSTALVLLQHPHCFPMLFRGDRGVSF